MRPIQPIVYLLAIVLFFSSCVNDSPITNEPEVVSPLAEKYDAHVVTEWTKLYLDIEKYLTNFRPAATARAISYTNMAAYHAAQPGIPSRKNLATIFPEANLPIFDDFKNAYHWPSAVNIANKITYEHFLQDMPVASRQKINELYRALRDIYERELSPGTLARSEEWGASVAQAMIDYARTDRAAEEHLPDATPASYIPPQGLGLWEGIHGPAYYPYWGNARTFGAYPDKETVIRPPFAPSVEPNSRFFRETMEVYEVVSNLSLGERWIAEFWSDDIVGLTFSPPARIIAIAEQLVTLEKMSLDKALYLYVKVGMASNDAGVMCWYGKYKYNLIRPDEWIRATMDPSFKTILNDPITNRTGISPSFPAYPSGHSTFASAGSGIFIGMLGNNYAFTDRCHEGRTEFLGRPRSFLTFTDLAAENAYSRIPLGVHFRMDCDEGLRLGYLVAERIEKLFD